MPEPQNQPHSHTTADLALDRQWMLRAVQLAARGIGHVEPNPPVGCVLVKDGQLIGEGYHQRFGGPHAEVVALQSLPDRAMARGATALVTLEPCCHVGKTPPCSEALIAAGVARVVVALQDPFPRVQGGGLAQLRAAGIDVSVGVCQAEATALLAPYLKRIERRRPWVIGKWAMTLDGKIATRTGDSQWISGEVSRDEVHRLRSRVDAVIVGGGTAAIDNPTLTARPPGAEVVSRVATRVVVASKRLPALSSRLVSTLDQAPLLLVTTPDSDPGQVAALQAAGVEILACPQNDPLQSVGRLLDELGRRQMTNVLVEGGGGLLGSFLAIDEIDEAHVYVGPHLFGGQTAPSPVAGPGFDSIQNAGKWQITNLRQLDGDAQLIARRVRVDQQPGS